MVSEWPWRRRNSHRFEPMNPAPPVIKSFMRCPLPYCPNLRAGWPERANEVAVSLSQDRPFETADGGPIRGERRGGGAVPGSALQHGLNRRLIVEIRAPTCAGGFENSPNFSLAARKRQNRSSHGQILEEL